MILLATHTRSQLENALASSTHALLFAGPEGAGKAHIARYFASRKLGLADAEALNTYPYFRAILPEHNTISIEQIRSLQNFLQLKTPGIAPTRRIALLEDAHHMTHEAQNALLKALEEPPADTVIILTAPHTLQLKETIYSRVQTIPVLTVTKQQVSDHFGTRFDAAHIEKSYTMSGGLAGLLSALIQDKDHVLISHIQTAKSVLTAPPFDRLLKVDELSKQKEQLPAFLHACKLICATALQQATAKKTHAQITQWHKRLTAVYETEAALPHNPNPKLLLTHLFLEM